MQNIQFTTMAQQAIQDAADLASAYQNSSLTTLHLAFALYGQKWWYMQAIARQSWLILWHLWEELKQQIKLLPKISGSNTDPSTTPETQKAIQKAQSYMNDMKDLYLSTEHLLLWLSTIGDASANLLQQHGFDTQTIQKAIKAIRGNKKNVTSNNPEASLDALHKYWRDITDMALNWELDPVIWRDDELRRTIQILSRKTKNNPVLVWEAWVWKTAIIELLAQKIIQEEVPDNLLGKKIIELDMWALIAWASHQWEFEERLKAVINELEQSEGQIIIFVDEVHMIVWTGKTQWAMDMSNLIKPSLARWKIKMIWATTLKEYRQYIEKDAALERRFQPVRVEEPQRDDAIAILRWIKSVYERHHWITITDDAVVAAVDLSKKYIPDRFLPDKAIDLMDEATAAVKMLLTSMPEKLETLNKRLSQLEIEKQAIKMEQDTQKHKERLEIIEKDIADIKERFAWWFEEREQTRQHLVRAKELQKQLKELEHTANVAEKQTDYNKVAEIRYSKIPQITKELEQIQEVKPSWSDRVTAEDIAQVVAKRTWIPATALTQSEHEKLSHLEEFLHKRVVWQHEAIKTVSNAIRRARAWLKDENKPIWSFLFVWPTWVWKTELAKALAELLFNDEKAITRIDMSEYMEKHAVSRLIGSPPWYVWHEAWWQLTEAVRKKPYCVLLFDEVEKAHPDVFHILLQLLDDGRLTDSMWKTVDFKHTIVIMTSNIWSQLLLDKQDTTLKDLMPQLQSHFRPEFLNRLDDIVLFEWLSEQMTRDIIAIQLDHVVTQLKKQKDLTLVIDSWVNEFLVTHGQDQAFGARPLKRAIQRYILDPLAMRLLEHTQHNEKVELYVKDDTIQIK